METSSVSSSGMLAFEIEAEHAPFFQETSQRQSEGVIGGLITKYSLFGGRNDAAHGGGSEYDDMEMENDGGFGGRRGDNTTLRGLLRSGPVRNALMALVVVAVFIHLSFNSESKVQVWEPASEELVSSSKPPKAHSFTFGGKNNMGHKAATSPPQAPSDDEGLVEEIMEDAFEKRGPWDVSIKNVKNEQGNYLHDPELSPFASGLYVAEQEELDRRQEQFMARMDSIVDQYGIWNNPGEKHAENGHVFDDFVFRDVFNDWFADNVWQKDEQYIRSFLDQAQSLVEATKEGIMEEYGHPNPTDEARWPFDVIIGDYEVLNGTAVHHESLEKLPGIAYLPQNSWDGLVRKLLHAMLTEDHFYVVVAGRAETYGANNFAQSQVMQFNYIMEPIFHKLGMTLISRNMGMNASTAVTALGGADIYGETDVLWHIQDVETEERHGLFDLLHRQMIMSGERVPVILSSNTDELTLASKGKAWVGNLQPGAYMCNPTHDYNLPVPAACRNLQCSNDTNAKCHVYNSVCWESRSDFTPLEHQNQDVGCQDQGYPGYREHQLEGRKMTLLLLHAINAAIDLWRQNLTGKKQSLPLDSTIWHVAPVYAEIRESIMTLKDRAPGEAAGFSASCELLMKGLDPRICHIPMHSFTEWTPRVVPRVESLLAIVTTLVEGDGENEAYGGPDILPLSWQIPERDSDVWDLDVHLIAIAANVTSGYDDDAFADLEYTDDWDSYNDDNVRKLKMQYISKAVGQGNLDSKGSDDGNKDYGEEGGLGSEQDRTLLSSTRRNLGEGDFWRLVDAPIGFCDGSAQSRCNRKQDNKCLLANHNHYKGSLAGTSKSGWLVMEVYGVRHGIILARLEFGNYDSSPSDLVFEYSVDGEVTSIPKAELDSFGTTIVDDLSVYPLLLAEGVGLDGHPDAMKYEVAIRIRSEDDPDYEVRLSHIYYA